MDCCEKGTHDGFCGNFNLEELEKRAIKMAAFSVSAVTAGNTIVVFTMLVLQELLEQLMINPVGNLTSIIQISASIGVLNNSIKIVP